MKSNKLVTTDHHQPRTLNKTLLSVVAVALGLILADHALAAPKSKKPTNISILPYTITAPGAYVVTQDLPCLGCSAAITIAGDSTFGNTVSRNLRTRNRGQGIRLLGSTPGNGNEQNTVQDNTCNGNGIGIAIGLYGYDNVHGNTIQNNTVNLNYWGILVEQGCTENTPTASLT